MIASLAMAAAIHAAQLPARPGYILGDGAQSCATWLGDAASENNGRAWIAGFWSGLNFTPGQELVGQSTDGEGIIGEVKLMCQQNPSMRLFFAVRSIHSRMTRDSR